MKNAAELLAGALARALADDARVMLAGDSFDLLQRLASAPVKELVVVSPLVSEVDRSGRTANDAPLHMRPDWLARTSSKDVIIDLDGTAPAEEVVRVLKKAGVYISPISSPVLEQLTAVTAVDGRLVGAILTDGDAPLALRLEDGTAGEHVQVWMGSKAKKGLVPPAIVGTLPAELAPFRADPAQAERLTDLEAGLAAANREVERLAHLEGALSDAEAQLTAQARSLEAAEALGQRALRLEDEVTRLRDDAAALPAAQARLAELEGEYDAVRAELAERRVDDRRYGLLRDRFEAARAELVTEIDTLREQLRAAGDPGVDLDTLVAERDAARGGITALTERLVPAVAESLALPLPAAPSAWTPDLIAPWLDAVLPLLAEVGQRPAIQVTQRAVDAQPALVVPAAPVDPGSVPLSPSANETRIALLQAELDAVRADRAAVELAWAERLSAARDALADRAQLVSELQTWQGRATDARRARLAAEDRQARLGAEVRLRDQRIADLEAIVATHGRMEGLLTDALSTAEIARDDALTEQRALAANLRMLQTEFERVSGGGQPDRRGAERARLAEQRAADAERRLAAAEERIARLQAERSLRVSDA